jgi:hypothetical protein
LFKKKPVPDSKVLRDVIGQEEGDGGGKVEFSVMVIGGAAAIKKGRGVEEEVLPGVVQGMFYAVLFSVPGERKRRRLLMLWWW